MLSLIQKSTGTSRTPASAATSSVSSVSSLNSAFLHSKHRSYARSSKVPSKQPMTLSNKRHLHKPDVYSNNRDIGYPPHNLHAFHKTLTHWTGERAVATMALQQHASWLHSLKDKIDLELHKNAYKHTPTYPKSSSYTLGLHSTF